MRNRLIRAFHSHRSLLAIEVIFVLLATLYNLSLPVYEAPDEFPHFSYANWLARGRGLPHLEDDLWQASHEIGQPPLYYALLAPAVSLIELSDIYNPAPFNRSYGQYGVVNARYHSPAERFPYHDLSLAVHMSRFLSTLMATVTIAATYGMARLIIPGQATLAAALVAFNPQFIFISAAVSNDTSVAALSALTLLALIWILTSSGVKRWYYILLGVLWGLSVLSKVSALGLGLVIAIGLFSKFRQKRLWLEFVKGGLAVALGMVTIAGWWFLRNWLLYGHPLAWPQFLNANRDMLRPELISWVETIRYAAFLRKTYWAWFAHGYPAPPVFYYLVNALMILALIGLVLWLIRKRFHAMRREQITAVALLALWSLVVFVSLMSWMRQAGASDQGRLLFPAISSLAVLMALGLANLGRRWPGLVLVTLLAAWAAAIPLLVIRPAFEHPQILPAGAEIPNPINVRYGEDILLLGYELEDKTVTPGETLDLTLYWQGMRPIAEDFVVNLRVIDSSGHKIALLEAIPYQGRYSTPEWQPGEAFADTYRLSSIPSQETAEIATVLVGLYPLNQKEEKLPVWLTEGQAGNEFAVAQFKIAPSGEQDFTPEQSVDTIFDQRFRLFGYDLPGNIRASQPFTTTLYWESLAPDGQAYTVFVHLYDESGQLVAQADSPPQNNKYPTSFWSAGEKIADSHRFDGLEDMPPGNYRLVVGLYDPVSGRRMAAERAGGQRWPDDSVSIEFEWGS